MFRYYTSEQALYRLLRLFLSKKPERTHSAAPPFQAANAPLVCGLMRWGFGLVHLFRQHSSENSGNHSISAVFITFTKSFDPHKLRLYLTPKAFFFDAFQKLPSGNTGPTHTVTHTTNCAERAKGHRRGNRFLSGALLACGTYRICAIKLPIFSAAFCCICRVAWV